MHFTNITGACPPNLWLCSLPEETAYPSAAARYLLPGEKGKRCRSVGGLATDVRTVEGAFWDQGVRDRWCGTAPEAPSGGNDRGEHKATCSLFRVVLHFAALVLDNSMTGSRSSQSRPLSLCKFCMGGAWCDKHWSHATSTCLVGMSQRTSSQLLFKEQDGNNVSQTSDLQPASSVANPQVEMSVVRFLELGILAAILWNVKSSGGNYWRGLIGLDVSDGLAYCWGWWWWWKRWYDEKTGLERYARALAQAQINSLALITEPPDYVCSRFLLCGSLTALESSAQTDGDLLREAIKSARLLFDSLSFGKKNLPQPRLSEEIAHLYVTLVFPN